MFIGDDITDEEGFAVVNELAGLSIRVGRVQGDTAARYGMPDVRAVGNWLENLACDESRTDDRQR